MVVFQSSLEIRRYVYYIHSSEMRGKVGQSDFGNFTHDGITTNDWSSSKEHCIQF